MKRWYLSMIQSGWLAHSVRTAMAGSCSLILAQILKLPEPYWAVVTTLVVMQSTMGASLDVSKRRLIGTALGAVIGGLTASFFAMNVILFGVVLLVMGIICVALRLDAAAYRFAGVALAIVTLIHRPGTPPFVIAFHRFAEVAIGIVIALALAALWPARDVTANNAKRPCGGTKVGR